MNKHINYATKEAVEVIIQKYNLINQNKKINKKINFSKKLKFYLKEEIYNKLPYQVSTSLYFIFRYFILLGFLDGKIGFLYHFIQGYWYRVLVGSKVEEIENQIKNIKSKKAIKKKIFLLTKLKI